MAGAIRSLFAQQMDCVQGWRVPTKLSGLPNAGETESQTEETIEFTKRSMLSCSQDLSSISSFLGWASQLLSEYARVINILHIYIYNII